MHLGIDLGTSNSVVAGLVDGALRVFRTADGGEVLPSVIYFDKRGHRLYGRRAYDMAITQPENVAAGFKRLMGTATPITVAGVELSLSAEECSAEIIRQLLGQAQTETGGEKVTGAVITIPAAFNQMQSEATLRAAQMAGLSSVALLPEPVAAAMAAMAGSKKSGQFLIYDLGGGTFDVALAQSLQGEVNIIAHQGINMLGGRDFDRMLVNEFARAWIADQFDLPENFQREPQYRKLIRAAQLAAEKAKIELSTLDSTKIFASDADIRTQDESGTDIYLDIPVTRKDYEKVIAEPVSQTIAVIRRLLEENGYQPGDIDRIVFIGGPSKTPMIRQMVSEQLGIAADLKADPLTAVAIGAAYFAESRVFEGAAVPAGATMAPETAKGELAAGVTAATLQADKESKGQAKPKATKTSRKAMQAEQVMVGLDIRIEHQARTPDEETTVTVYLSTPPNGRQIEMETVSGWSCDKVDLVDGLKIKVPLANDGTNRVRVTVFEADGRPLLTGSQVLMITRAVATTAGVPATQTLAVKVLDAPDAHENTLATLIEKGTLLPAEGQARYRAARDLGSGEPGAISLELFQLEYPDKTELNLCVGVFRITGEDLPHGYRIKNGDPIIFNWNMSDSGILQATVSLPRADQPAADANGVELRAPRFYSPQAGEVSFDPEGGLQFVRALLRQATDELEDVEAALGPEADRELAILEQRLEDQEEAIAEDGDDPEVIRRTAEETRFIRQDIARLTKRHQGVVLQRRLGKLSAIYNRVARERADPAEAARFDTHAAAVQKAIDAMDSAHAQEAERHLAEMRDLFFSAAWRDANYVTMWFRRLAEEPYLFPDQDEFDALTEEGTEAVSRNDMAALRSIVTKLLEARIAISPSDSAAELATIMRE